MQEAGRRTSFLAHCANSWTWEEQLAVLATPDAAFPAEGLGRTLKEMVFHRMTELDPVRACEYALALALAGQDAEAARPFVIAATTGLTQLYPEAFPAWLERVPGTPLKMAALRALLTLTVLASAHGPRQCLANVLSTHACYNAAQLAWRWSATMTELVIGSRIA